MKITESTNHERGELVTQSQMAAVLGCTPRTIANLVARGKIPSIKIGRLRRYQPHLVIAALTVEASASSLPHPQHP